MFIATTEALVSAGVSVNNNFTINRLWPYVEAVFYDALRPLLGSAFADLVLNQAVLSAPDKTYADLKPYLVRPLAKLAFAAYLPFAETQIGDDGITVSAVEGRKNAGERNIRDLRGSLLETGWNQVEGLLTFLAAHPADYPLYHDHLGTVTSGLLPTAGLFSQYYGIFSSRLTYQALQPTLDRLERDTLQPYLGDRWAVLTDSPTAPADVQLRAKLRTWLAFQTIAEAAPTLAIRIDGKGVRVLYGNATDTVDYFNPATDNQVARLIAACTTTATQAWDQAMLLLPPPDQTTPGRGLLDNSDSPVFFF